MQSTRQTLHVMIIPSSNGVAELSFVTAVHISQYNIMTETRSKGVPALLLCYGRCLVCLFQGLHWHIQNMNSCS